MTVAQLIERLNQIQDKDQKVYFYDGDYGWLEFTTVDEQKPNGAEAFVGLTDYK